MKLEYSRSNRLNFGDDLNPWLWPKLIGDCLREDDNIIFFGIGTILSQDTYKKCLSAAEKIVVFSSGAGDKPVPVMDKKWKVYCVRGPRTAKKMGLSPDCAIADGAYLIRTLNIPKPEKKHRVAFIPHHRSESYVDWEDICTTAGIHFVSPMQPVDRFLSDIQSCEKVITEAMHGAITADALRIPWVPARFAPDFCEEKWLDFFESVNVSPAIVQLPMLYQKRQPAWRLIRHSFKRSMARIFPCPEKWSRLPVSIKLTSDRELENLADALRRAANGAQGILSDDTVVADVTRKLTAKLEQVRDDYRLGLLF